MSYLSLTASLAGLLRCLMEQWFLDRISRLQMKFRLSYLETGDNSGKQFSSWSFSPDFINSSSGVQYTMHPEVVPCMWYTAWWVKGSSILQSPPHLQSLFPQMVTFYSHLPEENKHGSGVSEIVFSYFILYLSLHVETMAFGFAFSKIIFIFKGSPCVA